MMQRVGMAQALINDPDIVFLDEPMSGLDPIGRYQVREIILSLKQQGKTIFFNSHILSDVEKICDRIAILSKGQLINIGSLDEILGTTQNYHASFRISESITESDLQTWLSNYQQEHDFISGELQIDPQEFISSLESKSGKLITLNLNRNSLEEYFIDQLQDRT